MKRLLPPALPPAALLLLLPLWPLMVTVAPRSPLAHDAGYYSLQAHWIAAGGSWLAPLWFGQPLFDRCIGAQWLMALSLRLFPGQDWALGLPALLAAVISLPLCGWLAWRLLPGDRGGRPRRAAVAMAVLALTPLWIDHAHLATQDMLLLAVELAGLAGLLASEPQGRGGGALLAIAPFLLLERRWLLRRKAFWLGLALGWLPVLLWLGLSLQRFGLETVSGLWTKLLFLSGSDVYAAGPFYYLWNIPANTAPWSLAALAGWPLLARSGIGRAQRLVLLLYPLLLLVLLSSFRTKTPYYGLQLTPWIALAATMALERWSCTLQPAVRRLDQLIALLGGLLLLAAALALWPASPLNAALAASSGLPPLPVLAGSAAALGAAWLLLPLQSTRPRRLIVLLLGPWLALVLLNQSGLFSDRSPAMRRSLEAAPLQALLRQAPVQAAASAPLSGDDHARLILLALATPAPPDQLLAPAAVPGGQRVWIRRPELPAAEAWRILYGAPALGDWVLAERSLRQAGSPP